MVVQTCLDKFGIGNNWHEGTDNWHELGHYLKKLAARGRKIGQKSAVKDSTPRNSKIARVLYLRKTIETWGRGLTRIAAECRRVGLPLPTTTAAHGNVLTVFQRPGWSRTGTMSAITGTRWVVVASDPMAHLPNLRKDARANAEAVLHEIMADNSVTIPVICARTGMALRTINNAIVTLRDAGIVQSGNDGGDVNANFADGADYGCDGCLLQDAFRTPVACAGLWRCK